ncbi:MAG: hypothetical protein J0I77_16995 [Rudaea sp.]|uniref:hypothetical protein n=1 Tax=unclassified Rudaea TaxID=2627037 RepID=UPI0010F5EFF9|nr:MULTISPECIES: hypothetical protein [unclassified Rudaea]MBN8887423.1 hypothetical protein [Rudaea sp.]MBR0344758.1 hypothetical protein [Rudaea sp.]
MLCKVLQSAKRELKLIVFNVFLVKGKAIGRRKLLRRLGEKRSRDFPPLEESLVYHRDSYRSGSAAARAADRPLHLIVM